MSAEHPQSPVVWEELGVFLYACALHVCLEGVRWCRAGYGGGIVCLVHARIIEKNSVVIVSFATGTGAGRLPCRGSGADGVFH